MAFSPERDDVLFLKKDNFLEAHCQHIRQQSLSHHPDSTAIRTFQNDEHSPGEEHYLQGFQKWRPGARRMAGTNNRIFLGIIFTDIVLEMLPGTNHSRAIARSGVDWVCVDCEHGNIDGLCTPAGWYDPPIDTQQMERCMKP